MERTAFPLKRAGCSVQAEYAYGFRELGAEIIPYHTIDEIYEQVTDEDIVLDYIDQCNFIFGKFGKTPHIDDYPEKLQQFLGRKIWRDTINSISSHEEKWSAGYFVKPIRSKAFNGKVIPSINDLIGCGNCYENYEVLVSEALNIKAEWRCFILYDEIIDVRPYGMLIDPRRESHLYHYDANVLQKMIREFRNIENRPVACSMDICVTDDGRTLLMPNITPHICRHTYCSNMAKSGMNPKTLQYLMGHSDIGVTLNTYTHLGLEDAEDELKRLEDLQNARKELERTQGEKPVSQRMFKAI